MKKHGPGRTFVTYHSASETNISCINVELALCTGLHVIRTGVSWYPLSKPSRSQARSPDYTTSPSIITLDAVLLLKFFVFVENLYLKGKNQTSSKLRILNISLDSSFQSYLTKHLS